MVLVDTCGWIDWLTDGELAENYRPYLETPESLVVPSSLQFELYKWICRERNEATALEVIALTEAGRVVNLTTSLALFAADLALEHRLSFADAIIYATARNASVPLVTSDSPFRGLTGVAWFEKGGESADA